MSNEIPRRIRMDLWHPAELAIQNAVNEVEKMAADVRLTNAVILLGKARESVADFIDDVTRKDESASEKAHRLVHELSHILPDLDQHLHDVISNESQSQEVTATSGLPEIAFPDMKCTCIGEVLQKWGIIPLAELVDEIEDVAKEYIQKQNK